MNLQDAIALGHCTAPYQTLSTTAYPACCGLDSPCEQRKHIMAIVNGQISSAACIIECTLDCMLLGHTCSSSLCPSCFLPHMIGCLTTNWLVLLFLQVSQMVPLHYASMTGNAHIVSLLLQHKAHLNIHDGVRSYAPQLIRR
jgi:hypothetical protein